MSCEECFIALACDGARHARKESGVAKRLQNVFPYIYIYCSRFCTELDYYSVNNLTLS